MAESRVSTPRVAGRDAIERLRSPEGSLDRAALLSVLPYGEDFLFIDTVSKIESGEMEASFFISPQMPYVRAHFRDLPVMPGALVAEGWAQTGTLLVRYNLDDQASKVVLGMQIERTRFISPVWPGETLHYLVRLVALDSRAARLEGEARTEDRRIAKLRVVVGIMDRELFRAMTPGATHSLGE
jgi:3-hydroxyacyl-[acyl-carrier-protein] dehydratase